MLYRITINGRYGRGLLRRCNRYPGVVNIDTRTPVRPLGVAISDLVGEPLLALPLTLAAHNPQDPARMDAEAVRETRALGRV